MDSLVLNFDFSGDSLIKREFTQEGESPLKKLKLETPEIMNSMFKSVHVMQELTIEDDYIESLKYKNKSLTKITKDSKLTRVGHLILKESRLIFENMIKFSKIDLHGIGTCNLTQFMKNFKATGSTCEFFTLHLAFYNNEGYQYIIDLVLHGFIENLVINSEVGIDLLNLPQEDYLPFINYKFREVLPELSNQIEWVDLQSSLADAISMHRVTTSAYKQTKKHKMDLECLNKRL